MRRGRKGTVLGTRKSLASLTKILAPRAKIHTHFGHSCGWHGWLENETPPMSGGFSFRERLHLHKFANFLSSARKELTRVFFSIILLFPTLHVVNMYECASHIYDCVGCSASKKEMPSFLQCTVYEYTCRRPPPLHVPTTVLQNTHCR